MTELVIKKSGNDRILSLPLPALESLGLSVGSTLSLSVVDHKIILSPKQNGRSLEELLEASPKGYFEILPDDREWLNSPPVGRELI